MRGMITKEMRVVSLQRVTKVESGRGHMSWAMQVGSLNINNGMLNGNNKTQGID